MKRTNSLVSAGVFALCLSSPVQAQQSKVPDVIKTFWTKLARAKSVTFMVLEGYFFAMLWKRTKPTIEKRQTAFGEFVKTDTGWEGFVSAHDREIQVLVEDREGSPNPMLLQRLPDILKALPELEQTARQFIEQLTEEHLLTLITDVEEPGEFTLGFSWEQEDWGETVFVDFTGHNVMGWYTVD